MIEMDKYNAYHEPFIGGGAIFFKIKPQFGSINDINSRLMNFYRIVRNKPYNDETWSWHLGFQGITLAEYNLLTGDRSVLGTLQSTMDLLRSFGVLRSTRRPWKSDENSS